MSSRSAEHTHSINSHSISRLGEKFASCARVHGNCAGLDRAAVTLGKGWKSRL